MEDLSKYGVGGLLGALVIGIATLAGHLLNRSTTIDTKKLDDRGQLTRDLMEQLEKAFEELGELRTAVNLSARRELTLIRLLATIGGELRIVNGILSVHLISLNSEVLDREQLQQQTTTMIDCFERMMRLVDEENRRLNDELKRENLSPDPAGGKSSHA